MDTVEEPGSKAAIVWVVGEYCERIPLHAPDVLRKMAKAFCTQEVPVKLQVVNQAVKMYLTNPAQTKLITQYVFNLPKFDQNYDLRDGPGLSGQSCSLRASQTRYPSMLRIYFWHQSHQSTTYY